MKQSILVALLVLMFLFAVSCGSWTSAVNNVILATTTSTYDTGLLDVLIPEFERKTGYMVKPIVVGTGKALALGQRGEADALLVHAPGLEKALVDKGVVVNRRLVMHNHFAIVGPPGDPAGIKGGNDAAAALARVREASSLFISRGDDSGTHKMEKSLWAKAGIDPLGSWYQETGQGMGATLRIASDKQGYTLTDRGTYLSLKASLDLSMAVEGDPLLLNVYSVMQVNPAVFAKVNAEGGKAFVEFMLSPETQAIIRDFGVDKYGESLFIPDAGKTAEELSE